eukprot:symbB.v1.2.001079.t1/scaffold33.1/size517934/31
MASLLLASLGLAFLGYAWVIGVLLWNYPWLHQICSRCFVVLKFFCDCDLETVTLELGCETLKHSDPHVGTSGTQVLMGVTLQAFKLRLLQLLLFTSVAVALFGGSFVCFGFYLLRLKDEKGAMQLLPPAAAQVLDLSIFEIAEVVNRVVMRPFYDCIRVVLLINADLDENTRKEILEEMSPEFRRRVFQCSLASLLPIHLQKLALGKDFQASTDNKATMQDLFGSGDKMAFGEDSPVRRHRSLTDLLEFMRSVEGSSEKSRQSSVLQKILASKVSDGALWTMSQGAVHQYESHLSQRVHHFLDKISKEPERRVLRLPWRVLHWEVTVAHSVLTSVASWFSADGQESEVAKKDS